MEGRKRAAGLCNSIGCGTRLAARAARKVFAFTRIDAKCRRGTRIVLPSPNGSELTMEADVPANRDYRLFSQLPGRGEICRVGRKNLSRHRIWRALAGWNSTAGGGGLRRRRSDYRKSSSAASPEASAAIAAWNLAKNDPIAFLASCTSGRELIEQGFEEDVQIAGEINVSTAVPVLRERAYIRGEETVPPQDEPTFPMAFVFGGFLVYAADRVASGVISRCRFAAFSLPARGVNLSHG